LGTRPMRADLHLYYAPHCPICQGAKAVVEQAAGALKLDNPVQERNVVEHLDEAVAAGVRRTPALTLNGRLIAAGHLKAAQLARTLEQALSEQKA